MSAISDNDGTAALEQEIAELLRENERLLSISEEAAAQIELDRKRIRALKHGIRKLEIEYEELLQAGEELEKVGASLNWRVGRAVTWAPRRLLAAIRREQ